MLILHPKTAMGMLYTIQRCSLYTLFYIGKYFLINNLNFKVK